MTVRIDYYILTQTTRQAALAFACRLLSKAYDQNHQVWVAMDDAKEAQEFDQLLWTFSDSSFIPHELLSSGQASQAPIQISLDSQTCHQDILLNFCSNCFPAFEKFNRVIEIVPAADPWRSLARERYRHYQTHGSIKTHKMK